MVFFPFCRTKKRENKPNNEVFTFVCKKKKQTKKNKNKNAGKTHQDGTD